MSDEINTWKYWKRQAQSDENPSYDRLLAWEQAYNHLENALATKSIELAGCGVAALGGTKDVASAGDYGWSAAYQDTLDLRRRYDELKRVVGPFVKLARGSDERWFDGACIEDWRALAAAFPEREEEIMSPVEQKLVDDYKRLSGTCATGGFDGQGSGRAYMAGFLAGAKAERAAVLEIVTALLAKFILAEDADACYPLRLLDGQIRQREEKS